MYWGQMGHGHIVRGLAELRRGEQKASPFSFLNEEIINIMYSPFVESLFIVDFFFFSPEVAVSQLDQLSPEEQLLIKCAAVIGHSFHIDLLQHLLPTWDKHKLLKVLRALVAIHVLRWCSKSQEPPAEPILVPSSIEIIEETKEKKKKSGEE